MERLTWEVVERELPVLIKEAERDIGNAKKFVSQYPGFRKDIVALNALLSSLNLSIFILGELHARAEPLKTWTEKRYEIEKSLEVVRIVKSGKTASYAKEAKYENIQQHLEPLTQSAAIYLRIQNARSSARATADSIRSSMSLIKGLERSV